MNTSTKLITADAAMERLTLRVANGQYINFSLDLDTSIADNIIDWGLDKLPEDSNIVVEHSYQY